MVGSSYSRPARHSDIQNNPVKVSPPVLLAIGENSRDLCLSHLHEEFCPVRPIRHVDQLLT